MITFDETQVAIDHGKEGSMSALFIAGHAVMVCRNQEATAAIELDKEEARALSNFLLKWAGTD